MAPCSSRPTTIQARPSPIRTCFSLQPGIRWWMRPGHFVWKSEAADHLGSELLASCGPCAPYRSRRGPPKEGRLLNFHGIKKSQGLHLFPMHLWWGPPPRRKGFRALRLCSVHCKQAEVPRRQPHRESRRVETRANQPLHRIPALSRKNTPSHVQAIWRPQNRSHEQCSQSTGQSPVCWRCRSPA